MRLCEKTIQTFSNIVKIAFGKSQV